MHPLNVIILNQLYRTAHFTILFQYLGRTQCDRITLGNILSEPGLIVGSVSKSVCHCLLSNLFCFAILTDMQGKINCGVLEPDFIQNYILLKHILQPKFLQKVRYFCYNTTFSARGSQDTTICSTLQTGKKGQTFKPV